MNTKRDPDRLIHAFLMEGQTDLADQVYDAVRATIEHKRQRVVIGPWRMPTMNKLMPIALGAAAVVVALVAGTQLLGPPAPDGVGAPPAATPSPSPEPSVPVPSVAASPSLGDRSLPEGPFVFTDGELDDGLRNVPVTVTIPTRGWYGTPGGGILGNAPEDLDFSSRDAGVIGPFVGDIYVPADPCQWSTTMPESPATTVDEVVAALQGQASRDASEPVDITVDGHEGKSLTLHVPEDAVFSQCDRTEFCTLTQDNPAACHRFQQFPGQVDELWILDVDGEVAVIDATWGEETPAEAKAELRAILESMTFGT